MAKSAAIAILGLYGLLALVGLIGLIVWFWRRSKRDPVLLIEPLDIGTVISGTFAAFSRKGLPVLILASVAVGLPQILSGILLRGAAAQMRTAPPFSAGWMSFLATMFGVMFVGILIGLILHIAGMRFLVRLRLGEAGDLPEALRAVPGLFLPALGLWILFMLGAGFASLFLLWPGILLSLSWSVAFALLVMERGGVFASLRNSRELTVGSRGRILLVYILLAVVFVALFGVQAILQRAVGVGGIAGIAITALGSTCIGVLNIGFASALYVELRRIHGGTAAPAGLADIFS
jgi:hypothetical protein